MHVYTVWMCVGTCKSDQVCVGVGVHLCVGAHGRMCVHCVKVRARCFVLWLGIAAVFGNFKVVHFLLLKSFS